MFRLAEFLYLVLFVTKMGCSQECECLIIGVKVVTQTSDFLKKYSLIFDTKVNVLWVAGKLTRSKLLQGGPKAALV